MGIFFFKKARTCGARLLAPESIAFGATSAPLRTRFLNKKDPHPSPSFLLKFENSTQHTHSVVGEQPRMFVSTTHNERYRLKETFFIF